VATHNTKGASAAVATFLRAALSALWLHLGYFIFTKSSQPETDRVVSSDNGIAFKNCRTFFPKSTPSPAPKNFILLLSPTKRKNKAPQKTNEISVKIWLPPKTVSTIQVASDTKFASACQAALAVYRQPTFIFHLVQQQVRVLCLKKIPLHIQNPTLHVDQIHTQYWYILCA